MWRNLSEVENNRVQLEAALANPELARDPGKFKEIAQKHSELARLAAVWRQLKKLEAEFKEAEDMLFDEQPEMRELAREESRRLAAELEAAERELNFLLMPRDPDDDKNILLEIRAGAGGNEAALFAADLFRMYARYAEKQRWKVEILSSNPTGEGGFKEIILLIEGRQVYSHLKYESGVHRVQRVPDTETQGRVHTSTVTVAVLPEAEEVELDIRPEEIKVDVYRSSGPGGQSVNTTDSAVRVTHLPSGMVVTCQDEKSQHKNKEKALQVLRARLLDRKNLEQRDKMSEDRRRQVGTGERSERIRTYNYPQGRVTDHRLGLTLYRLTDIMDGSLTELVEAATAHFRARLSNPARADGHV